MDSGLSRLRLRAGMLIVGVVAGCTVVGLPGAVQAMGPAPDGFACDGQIFESAGDNRVRLYTATDREGTVSFSPVGPAARGYNAIGVDPKSQYVFGIRNGTNRLVRINNKGIVTDVGAITGLPAPRRGGYIIGAFDPSGDYYLMNPDANATTMYRVDVSARKVTRSIRLTSRVLPGLADFTYAGSRLWGAGSRGGLQRIDPATGKVTDFAGKVPATSGYGGAFTYKNGDLGFIANKGFVARVAVASPDSATPTFKLVSKQAARPAGILDGAACVAAHPQPKQADLQLVKTGPTSVPLGSPVTYKITVKNKGPAVSSGWTVDDTMPIGLRSPRTSTPGCTITGARLYCIGGQLAVGASATITVTGTAPEPRLDNTATVRGNDPDPTPGNNTACLTTYLGSGPQVEARSTSTCR